MTNTYRSLFSGKEIDEAIIGLRSLSTSAVSVSTATDTSARTVFTFDRKINNFVKLSIVGLTTEGSTGATYIESNITCAVGAQPSMVNRLAVLSGTLAITVTVDYDGDNVLVKVAAPVGTVIKVQPVQIF